MMAARAAWNAMGGLEWNALEIVSDYLEIDDMDSLISDLIYIRDNRDA